MAIKNRIYPHLSPGDIITWEAFLADYPDKYNFIEYDVRVGAGRPAHHSHPPNIQQMAIDLSQRRIDAIGHTPDCIDLIEITPRLGFRALGQIICYEKLYREKFPGNKPIHCIIVCQEIGTDLNSSITALNVHCEIFGPEGTSVSLNRPRNW